MVVYSRHYTVLIFMSGVPEFVYGFQGKTFGNFILNCPHPPPLKFLFVFILIPFFITFFFVFIILLFSFYCK